jgi:hypothetical protein
MNDESGTHEYKLSDIDKPSEPDSRDGFSKDEIDSLANLISGEEESKPKMDLEDTGRFTR